MPSLTAEIIENSVQVLAIRRESIVLLVSTPVDLFFTLQKTISNSLDVAFELFALTPNSRKLTLRVSDLLFEFSQI